MGTVGNTFCAIKKVAKAVKMNVYKGEHDAEKERFEEERCLEMPIYSWKSLYGLLTEFGKKKTIKTRIVSSQKSCQLASTIVHIVKKSELSEEM